jgi:hypothetical protein
MMNLKAVTPNLVEWTSTPGEGYDDLEELYGELIGQWSRYVGHVITNIGGVYLERVTSDQDGDVYRPVPKEVQEESMQFMVENAFTTPHWLLDESILRNIEHAGAIERIQSLQGRHLAEVMDTDRMNRVIEDEAFRGDEAYTLAEMLEDVRTGIWSELDSGEAIDPYRRNLQRTYIDAIHSLMESDNSEVNISDIKPMLRDELRMLSEQIDDSISGAPDRITRVHLIDIQSRIENILDPS